MCHLGFLRGVIKVPFHLVILLRFHLGFLQVFLKASVRVLLGFHLGFLWGSFTVPCRVFFLDF